MSLVRKRLSEGSLQFALHKFVITSIKTIVLCYIHAMSLKRWIVACCCRLLFSLIVFACYCRLLSVALVGCSCRFSLSLLSFLLLLSLIVAAYCCRFFVAYCCRFFVVACCRRLLLSVDVVVCRLSLSLLLFLLLLLLLFF